MQIYGALTKSSNFDIHGVIGEEEVRSALAPASARARATWLGSPAGPPPPQGAATSARRAADTPHTILPGSPSSLSPTCCAARARPARQRRAV